MPARRSLALLLLAAVAALVVARADPDGAGGSDGLPADARVTRVVDGDTIHVELHGRDETVRYIGIDTPESVKPGTPVQCYAKAASHENERLVAGREVRLVGDREPRDRYGRLLAYVYRADTGAFVNEQLVDDGFARTLRIAPNDHFATRFAVGQAAARTAGRGLWRACSV